MRQVHSTMRTEGIRAFSNRYGIVVWTGENDTKTISVDANLFENGLVWTGPLETGIQCIYHTVVTGTRQGLRSTPEKGRRDRYGGGT